MKILHFCYDHPDNPWLSGGGARRTWAINSILAQFHEIDVVCGSFTSAELQEKPFRVFFAGKAGGYKESRLKYILASRKYYTADYDLVVEDFSAYAPVFPCLQGKPMVSIIHAHYGLGALRYRGLLGVISICCEKILLPRRKNVILVSDHLQSVISSSAKTAVIGQGVDIPKNLSSSTEEFVLYLGRLDVHVKGLDVLIKAWASIPRSNRKYPLYIAGGGDQEPLRRLIHEEGAEDVHLLGRLDHYEAFETINRAAFVCMPSRSEGFGLSAIEAMSLGKPVIASDIPSLKANVLHDISGLIVPAGNPSALGDAIKRLMKDSEKRKVLMEGACRLGKRFTWENAAEEQNEFYLGVFGSRLL